METHAVVTLTAVVCVMVFLLLCATYAASGDAATQQLRATVCRLPPEACHQFVCGEGR